MELARITSLESKSALNSLWHWIVANNWPRNAKVEHRFLTAIRVELVTKFYAGLNGDEFENYMGCTLIPAEGMSEDNLIVKVE